MDNVHPEILQQNYAPLHYGRSFFRYRDVNKAIEKHRELFGLRLALKRAIKLENYCLTVEQMKDLNLRLKYGELDYHCFIATGRPGRPGNLERCPQLVRLKLSPDAQSLIVYETHNHTNVPYIEEQHNMMPTMQGFNNSTVLDIPAIQNQPICIKGDITVTPIGNDNAQIISPVAVLPKINSITRGETPTTCTASFIINNKNSFTSLVPVNLTPTTNTIQIKPKPEVSITVASPSTPITQNKPIAPKKSPDSHEKITVKIKKSECVPNEMVVVGSLRHAQEQMKNKSHNEASQKKPLLLPKSTAISIAPTSTVTISKNSTSVNIAPKLINDAKSNTQIANGTNQKVASSKINSPKTISISSAIKPVQNAVKQQSQNNSQPKSGESLGNNSQGSSQVKNNSQGSSQVKNNSQGSSQVKNNSQGSSQVIRPSSVPSKPTVIKQSSSMKQVIINKPTPKNNAIKKPLINKQHDTNGNNEKPPSLISKPASPVLNNGGVRPVGPRIMAGSKSIISKSSSSNTNLSLTNSDTPVNKSIEKVNKPVEKSGCINKPVIYKPKDRPVTIMQKQTSNNAVNGTKSSSNNKVIITVQKKKLKKRPGRPQESSNFNHRFTGSSMNTELEFNDKQSLAHGVLLQLLRVTSQLPMVDFSHALETLEDLTTAFKLNQKVTLSIRHDEEGTTFLNGLDYLNDNYNNNNEVKEQEANISTTNNKLAYTQLDGQFDMSKLLMEVTYFPEVGQGPQGQRRRVSSHRSEIFEDASDSSLNYTNCSSNSASISSRAVKKFLKRASSPTNEESEFKRSKK